MFNRVQIGDCRETLKTLPAGVFQCCVTSPPYWGLRDYGHADQLGLEKTPAEYVANMVAVFAEVRRVLRDDGVLFLNLGDSYAGSWKNQGRKDERGTQRQINGPMLQRFDGHPAPQSNAGVVPDGLKPKDLVGIPWRVAFALQQSRYTGTILDERDRIWLAAMLDAEGCIFIHKRKAGQSNGQGYERKNDSYGPGVEIANTSRAIVDRVLALVGKGSICSQTPEQNPGRKQTIHRWNLRTIECRDFLREVYPYLVAKKQQARIAIGCPSSGERADAAHGALIALHRGSLTDVDFPEPPAMFEPGWYLRSDVIWNKLNPMPESVTDRPTKAHEYVFLLSKSERYFWDADAVREECSDDMQFRAAMGHTRGAKGKLDSSRNDASSLRGESSKQISNAGRNIRSVWTIATQPYHGAHFATMPPKLVERCILAGSKIGDVVLDPFLGSGTVGEVAEALGRRWFGCELNPEYEKLIKQRTAQAGLFGRTA